MKLGGIKKRAFSVGLSMVLLLQMLPIVPIKANAWDSKNVKQEITSDEYRLKTKWPIKGGIICGCVLCTAMSLQQYGISIYPKGALYFRNGKGTECRKYLWRMVGYGFASWDVYQNGLYQCNSSGLFYKL